MKEGWEHFWRKAGKALKKSQKTGKKSSAENRKKHLCRKRENAIFKTRKPRKIGKYGGNRKHNLKFVETGKVLLEAAESWKSPKRQ